MQHFVNARVAVSHIEIFLIHSIAAWSSKEDRKGTLSESSSINYLLKRLRESLTAMLTKNKKKHVTKKENIFKLSKHLDKSGFRCLHFDNIHLLFCLLGKKEREGRNYMQVFWKFVLVFRIIFLSSFIFDAHLFLF